MIVRGDRRFLSCTFAIVWDIIEYPDQVFSIVWDNGIFLWWKRVIVQDNKRSRAQALPIVRDSETFTQTALPIVQDNKRSRLQTFPTVWNNGRWGKNKLLNVEIEQPLVADEAL